MNLSFCRVCKGDKYVIHSKSISLPIHIWPLKGSDGHILEDALTCICKECGHVQLQTLDEAFIASLYAKGSFVEDNLGMKKERLEILEKIMGDNLFTNKRVLDIGGGHNPFVELIPESETWIVDIDVDDKSQKCADNVLEGWFEDVDLPKDYFDVITSFHTIEHLSAPADVVQKVAEIIKPGGIVIIEVPNLSGIIDSIPYYAIFHQHINLFTPVTMDCLFNRYGFIRKKLIRSDSVILVAYEKGKDSYGIPSHYSESVNLISRLRERLTRISTQLERCINKWDSKRLGFYGAGGSTTLFLANFPQLSEQIEICFDQDRKKHGRFIPGTKIQVYSPDDINAAPLDILLFINTSLYESLSPNISKDCFNLEQLWKV